MKIAVYTIALNEEKHVKRWYESAKDADLLVIADTGSTDKTRYLAKSLGISVTEIEVNPWRFDVARNASLALIPEDFDVCIQLDMDEVLPTGWRTKVEDAFNRGNTWPIYKHVTSRDPQGKPRNYQHYFKIHPRKGFYWKYPIHEVLVHLPELHFERELLDLEVDHIKDPSKSRKSYLDLLEKAVEEEPTDWRMNHYLNREYFYNADWLKVIQSAYQCETISGGWDVERASTYMWASEAAHHLKMTPLAEEWAKKGTDAAPNFYEVWHWRAHIAHLNKRWFECLDFASKIQYLSRQNHHLVKPDVWEWWGFDLIALSNNKLGNFVEALIHGKKAFDAKKNDPRLKQNLDIYITDYRSSLPRHLLTENEKLAGFPKVYVINLDSSVGRLKNFQNQLSIFNITNWQRVSAKLAENRDEKIINLAILSSHISAVKSFLTEINSEFAVICEDDLIFENVTLWKFTWNEIMEKVRKNGIEILQLSLITKSTSTLQTGLRLRRDGIDWSSGIYLISRKGGEALVEKFETESHKIGIAESDLFDKLDVYCLPIFSHDTAQQSTVHQSHIDLYHKPSFLKLRESFLNDPLRGL